MRGRVGRSNKKAFCFFITPPYEVMTPDARKRIEALEQFTELGSGFNIAMKDLEIRGAGDLLGGEQSGFINEIGFETYQKILTEAIEELKENEFKELYEEVEGHKEKVYVKDIQLDTDFELLFPDDYINNITERLNLYTQLNEVKDELGDSLKIVKIDVDKNQSLAGTYQVRGVPTMMLFKNGKQLWRQSGVLQKTELLQVVRSYL